VHRWGRLQESVSEDPWLNGAYSNAFVKGFQGDGDGIAYTKAGACCKHFRAYSLEGGVKSDGPTPTRHNFDAEVSARELAETYMPPFHACVAAAPEQVMCSCAATADRTRDPHCSTRTPTAASYQRHRPPAVPSRRQLGERRARVPRRRRAERLAARPAGLRGAGGERLRRHRGRVEEPQVLRERVAGRGAGHPRRLRPRLRRVVRGADSPSSRVPFAKREHLPRVAGTRPTTCAPRWTPG
jgi:hypothetical protein